MKFLEGKKTYIFIVLLLALFVLDSQGWIPPGMEKMKEELYAFLAAGAGISLRLGMKKDNQRLKGEVEEAIKKHNGGSQMKSLLLLFVPILGLTMFVTSCAKDVGEDNVPKIAATIELTLETVTEEGLKILEDKDPGQVTPAIADLETVNAKIKLYLDGVLTVGDVAESLGGLFERMNERFALVASDDTARILKTLTTVARIIEIYFLEVDIPEDAVIYAGAVSTGIQTGLSAYLGPEPDEGATE